MDLFRKPKKRKGASVAVRQREDSSEDDETQVKDVVKRKRRNNPMVQSTQKSEKISRLSSDSESSNDDVAVAEHSFAATGEAGPSGPRDQGATFTLEIDTDYSRDAQAQFERVQAQLKEGVEKDGKVIYKGAALYGAKEAKDTIKGNAASGRNRIGPVRAPQFLRQTVRWDFAPDVCKDYKETGYCTFGDSCKFVHDRGDYKHGWEIDEDYEAGRYGAEDDENYEINEEEEMFPDDCFVCGNPFVDPIVTKCKHYFCESCALKIFKKTPKCPVCNQNTEKIMNSAKDLIGYLKRKKARKQEEEQEAEENNFEEKPVRSSCEGHSHDHDEKEYSDNSSTKSGMKYEEQELENEEQEQEDDDQEREDEEQAIVMEDVENLCGGENESDSESD